MTNMRTTADIKRFVRSLVLHNATYDKIGKCYSLNVKDVNDFDLDELAALIMISDSAYASEANGPDNPSYEKIMLPALLRYMRNSTERDEEIEFTKTWREGVTNYFLDHMQTLISDECSNYLHESFNEAGLYAKQRPDNGELYWSGH